jgi:transcriptional regulator with GAF, ATPase, and Fis domain
VVRRRADLIDQFADLVVRADDPRRLAERTLEVVMSLNTGRSGAVFSRNGDALTLFASRGIDQTVLDAIQTIWTKYRESLENGETFYVPDRALDRRLPEQVRTLGVPSFAVVPVRDGDSLIAVLYLDSVTGHFCDGHALDRLSKFAKIVAKAVRDASGQPEQDRARAEELQAYLERTPVEELEREKLLLLLNRNEWNIARVARLMGVTRRTIYLRLERYKIPREKVRKTLRPRPATA